MVNVTKTRGRPDNLVLGLGHADIDISAPGATKETSDNVKEACGS